MFASAIKNVAGMVLIGTAASVALSGCTVSDDPNVNRATTAAVIGTAAALLYYNVSDGYYYDDNYRRLPRNYRPNRNSDIRRVDNLEEYRRRNSRYYENDRRHDYRRYDGRRHRYGYDD